MITTSSATPNQLALRRSEPSHTQSLHPYRLTVYVCMCYLACINSCVCMWGYNLIKWICNEWYEYKNDQVIIWNFIKWIIKLPHTRPNIDNAQQGWYQGGSDGASSSVCPWTSKQINLALLRWKNDTFLWYTTVKEQKWSRQDSNWHSYIWRINIFFLSHFTWPKKKKKIEAAPCFPTPKPQICVTLD